MEAEMRQERTKKGGSFLWKLHEDCEDEPNEFLRPDEIKQNYFK